MLATRRTEIARTEADEARLRRLFDEHFSSVWRFVRRLGVAETVADDATQQVFWVLAERLSVVEQGTERAFLTGTALRVAANYRRSVRRRREVSSEPLEHVVDPAGDPERIAEHRSELLLLDRALDTLPSELRSAFVLFELGDLSMQEIAQLLGIPRGTVASRLRRARAEFTAAARALQGGNRE